MSTLSDILLEASENVADGTTSGATAPSVTLGPVDFNPPPPPSDSIQVRKLSKRTRGVMFTRYISERLALDKELSLRLKELNHRWKQAEKSDREAYADVYKVWEEIIQHRVETSRYPGSRFIWEFTKLLIFVPFGVLDLLVSRMPWMKLIQEMRTVERLRIMNEYKIACDRLDVEHRELGWEILMFLKWSLLFP